MPFSQRLWVLSLFVFLLLPGCGTNEEDYKSDVPVSHPSLQERVDSAQVATPPKETESQNATPEELPHQINLDVPFFSQAPDGDWSLPWQEACEESSLILAYAYANNQPLSKQLFKTQILKMVKWQNETFGDYEHTTVDQTAQMLEQFLGFAQYDVLENPSVDDLKKNLAQGHVVVAPFAGRELGNPFYSGEGPRYHMMVIRGYDEAHFITNDVGTRRGENFIYPYQVLMNALHDWHETDMNQGEKKVIVLRKG